MPESRLPSRPSCSAVWAAACAVLAVLAARRPRQAQYGAIRQVGGVWINADGLLRNIETDETNQLRALREKALQPAAGGLEAAAPLRKISLRRLEARSPDQLDAGKPLPTR